MLWKLVLLTVSVAVGLTGPSPAAAQESGPGVVSPDSDRGHGFLVGAFNAKVLGRTKMSDPIRAERIKQIVQRYDVVLVQEIRDRSERSVHKLHRMLNRSLPINFTISQPLGSGRYKEQYAYFYRSDRMWLVDTYQYPDESDVFQREPYTALFALRAPGIPKLALIGLHTSPTKATEEIGNLSDVIPQVYTRFGPHVQPIVLGDLNADCRYSSHEDRVEVNDQLTSDPSYVWLIQDHVDTTVKTTTHCAYDRIIIHADLLPHVQNGSAQAFDFCQDMQLTYNTECHRVSDHYPVEMVLQY